MWNMDRKTSVVMAVGGAAYVATVVALARWGLMAKHPVIGIAGGILIAGPAAGAIAANVTRAVVGPSVGNMAPIIQGGPAGDARPLASTGNPATAN